MWNGNGELIAQNLVRLLKIKIWKSDEWKTMDMTPWLFDIKEWRKKFGCREESPITKLIIKCWIYISPFIRNLWFCVLFLYNLLSCNFSFIKSGNSSCVSSICSFSSFFDPRCLWDNSNLEFSQRMPWFCRCVIINTHR